MYHVYQNQASAAYSSLYFFIFLSLQCSTLKFFVTLFLGTMRPRRLKLGAHMDSGQIYHVYQNQTAAAYSSFYFTHIDSGQMYHVYQNQAAAAAYLFLYFFIFLSLQFSNIKMFLSHLSQELWDLEGWNVIPTWTVGGWIVYTESFHNIFLQNWRDNNWNNTK